MVFMAVFADVITPYDPEANDFEFMLAAPNSTYWLGTDQFGRDQLTRIIYGARTALYVGFVCAFIGAFAGLVLGVASAYFGGMFDLLFQRVMDVFMAFPLIILALAVVSILGTGTSNVIIAITIPFIPQCARVVRSSALAIREIPYVDAARAMGFSHKRTVPDYADDFRWSGYFAGSVPLIPGPWCAGTDACLGSDATGRGGRICRKRALGRHFPWLSHYPGRIRL
jgi:peptide/nickel transport system permease protein